MSTVKTVSDAVSAVASLMGKTASGILGYIPLSKVLNVKALPSNTDLNDMRTPGFYFFSSTTLNSPFSGVIAANLLFVFSHSEGYVQQIAIRIRQTPVRICARYVDGASAQWKAWQGTDFAPMTS